MVFCGGQFFDPSSIIFTDYIRTHLLCTQNCAEYSFGHVFYLVHIFSLDVLASCLHLLPVSLFPVWEHLYFVHVFCMCGRDNLNKMLIEPMLSTLSRLSGRGSALHTNKDSNVIYSLHEGVCRASP